MEQALIDGINQYGFPIIAAIGISYLVFYVWKWATEEIDSILGDAQMTLIKLIDRIRMLDNDMIRLNTKITMVLEYKAKYEQQTGEKLDLGNLDVAEVQRRYSSQSSTWKQPDNSEKKAVEQPKK